jgi:glycine/D-amino acid oxidase-like deaminating enzyme
MEAATPYPEAQQTSSPSLWWDGLERDAAEPPLETDTTADIAIVGGGYTGLWTAYFLKQIRPDVDVVLVEAKHIGHGASGRNGGWLMGALEGCDAFVDDSGTLPATARQQLTQLVSRAGEILANESIDCDFHHGGCVMAAARHDAQVARAKKFLAGFQALGFGEDDYRWLTPSELRDRIQVANPGGAVFTPHVARIQPAKLVTGLARVAKSLGVRVFEHTRAHAIDSGVIHCDRGTIRAEQIVIATEGYSEEGNPLHRRLIPVQTGMVATEPLSDAQWANLGFANNETFADCTRAATYLQRTADNRLVIGARGHYQPGGLPQHGLGDTRATGQQRERIALSLFPQLAGVHFTHNWGGSVGVPRGWHPHVICNAYSGIATAGGYVGEGVGASFLFGQTLAELLTGEDTDRTQMPWVMRRSLEELKRWEPEPFPRLGLKATMMAFSAEEWLLERYGEGAPARAAGWLCDQLDPH